ncbi:hypothetical protein BDN70DRAFT_901080 [Pholiota conissans]|uniref:Uncharacterized protein n=1 Tax=Pholiota conissans TaxID=109636 RepID=A0A9P6CT53_9AGAR|nr:hypothetical protein BDN70DRAFT_901080 [Pholiota conissans]
MNANATLRLSASAFSSHLNIRHSGANHSENDALSVSRLRDVSNTCQGNNVESSGLSSSKMIHDTEMGGGNFLNSSYSEDVTESGVEEMDQEDDDSEPSSQPSGGRRVQLDLDDSVPIPIQIKLASSKRFAELLGLTDALRVEIRAEKVEALHCYRLTCTPVGPALVPEMFAYACHNLHFLACGAVTDTEGNMNRHQAARGHGKEVKRCERCDTAFTNVRDDALKRHRTSGACERRVNRRTEAEKKRMLKVKKVTQRRRKKIMDDDDC